MRRTLAENLVIIGGTSMLPGFNHRLRSELYAHLKQPPYSEKLSLPAFKFHKYPAKANYVAWLGGKSYLDKNDEIFRLILIRFHAWGVGNSGVEIGDEGSLHAPASHTRLVQSVCR
jgi:hypothetical protein